MNVGQEVRNTFLNDRLYKDSDKRIVVIEMIFFCYVFCNLLLMKYVNCARFLVREGCVCVFGGGGGGQDDRFEEDDNICINHNFFWIYMKITG